MTRFTRPVQGSQLLAAPELSLGLPGQMFRNEYRANEGEGTGYDQGFPYAYGERWFEYPGEAQVVADHYAQLWQSLGWHALDVEPDQTPRQVEVVSYVRDDDESLSLTNFGSPASELLPRGYRLDLRILGSWPDGGDDYRPR